MAETSDRLMLMLGLFLCLPAADAHDACLFLAWPTQRPIDAHDACSFSAVSRIETR